MTVPPLLSRRNLAPDGASSVGDGVLDHAIVIQLRERFTMAQREQLVDVFDTQQEQCLAAIGGAIGRGDAVELRQLAHRLQGSSASLGASRLSACAQRLEQGEGQDVELRSAQITELRARVAEAMQALRLELKNAA